MDKKKSLIAITTVLLTTAVLSFGPPPLHSQITGFDVTAIHVTLTSVPGAGSAATGVCTGDLDPASGLLGLTCSHDVSSGDVVITSGPPAGGNVLVTLGSGRIVSAEVTLTEAQVAALLTGRLHVAVITSARPLGEIAARLVPRTPIGEQVMRFPLREDSLARSGSSATGDCALRIHNGQSTFRLLCIHNVSNPVELRVLIDGGTVATVSDVASPFEATLPVLAASPDRFFDGDFGVVLTSAAFPAGEIGMVLDKCVEGPHTLCLTDERFRVTVEVTPRGQSTRLAGTVPDRSADAGLFWFFRPDNWEVLVKVLNACNINQHFWVFLSANTDVKFKVTIFDTLTGRTRVFENAQGNVAVPRADTSAFSCN